MTHTDPRYLQAKKTVDERARSRRVKERFLRELPPNPRICDIGAGTGVMMTALGDWGVRDVTYIGIDRNHDVLSVASERAQPEDMTVSFINGDALDILPNLNVDVVIAQAILDLVPIDEALSAIEAGLTPGGLAYLPITFDGVTIFQPSHSLDQAVIEAYHRGIDRQPGRTVHAGRQLIDRCTRAAGELLAVAGSDWIVHPHQGTYPHDEHRFLMMILEFIEETADLEGNELTSGAFDEWLATRRSQVQSGSLSYIAHQYDLLYRTAGDPE